MLSLRQVGRLQRHARNSRWLLPIAQMRLCTSASQKESEQKLFAPENVEGISEAEVNRMKITYGFLKEHIEAVEKGLAPPDPKRNPIIDSRSFDVRQLPAIPDEVLQALRRQLPAKLAATARPVPTFNLWEEGGGAEAASAHGAQWAAVDARTMEHRHFSKMQRQASHGLGVAVAPTHAPPMARVRRRCALKDERGRVCIDFRAVGKLSAFVSDGGKILAKRKTHLSAKGQRRMARAVKSARQMALFAPDPRPGPTMDDFRAAAAAMEDQ